MLVLLFNLSIFVRFMLASAVVYMGYPSRTFRPEGLLGWPCLSVCRRKLCKYVKTDSCVNTLKQTLSNTAALQTRLLRLIKIL